MYDFNQPPTNLFQQMTALSALHTAWRKVRANRGAAGIDAVSLHTFEANLAANLQELARSLVSRSYQPLPARFVTDEDARRILKAWLDAPFEGGRHERRVVKIDSEDTSHQK